MNKWEYERFRTARENNRQHFVQGDNKRILQLAFEYSDVLEALCAQAEARYQQIQEAQIASESAGLCWAAYLAAMSDDESTASEVMNGEDSK